MECDCRDLVELARPFDDLVRDSGERPLDGVAVEQNRLALRVSHAHPRRPGRSRAGRVIRTPFRPHWTGLKGFGSGGTLAAEADDMHFGFTVDLQPGLDGRSGKAAAASITASQATPWRGRHASGERRPLSSGFVDPHAIKRLADLAVDFSANVQPGQIVAIEAETGMEPIVRAVAERAYERGARFVDPTYFDPYVKKARLQHAPEDTLEFVPEWYGKRMLQLGDVHAARIIFVPRVSPGILNGVDPKRAGRDQLPDLRERLVIINKRLVNWTIMPYPTQPWADLVF